MAAAAGNLIDGEWRPARGGKTFDDLNPADTRDVVGRLAASDAQDVDDAVEAAARAFPAWAGMPAPVRGRYLLEASRALEARLAEASGLLSREEGKTIAEAEGEVARRSGTWVLWRGEGSRLGGG